MSHLLREELRRIADLEFEDDLIPEAAEDFGHLVSGRVSGVVRPLSFDAVVALVQVARRTGVTLTPRTLGYSQSGQSLSNGGLSVDMRKFRRMSVSDEGWAECGGAISWRELMAAAAPLGFAPEVVPLNLDLSIAGTLSAGGIGSTSHRYGMALSSVESLVAVSGRGDLIRATPTENSDVFDGCLGGVGQFGFLCEARLRLRRSLPMIRTYYLLYENISDMLSDQAMLRHHSWCTHLEGFASAAVLGLKVSKPGQMRVPFARWLYGLQVSEEFSSESPPVADKHLASCKYREIVHVDDDDALLYASRYDRRFSSMKLSGLWEAAHPWLEIMLPFDVAVDLLPEVLPKIPLHLGDGHRIMIVADTPHSKFSIRPVGDPTILFAVLPVGVPSHALPDTLPALREVHDILLDAGGKRYLSGWLFEPNAAAWSRHFGDKYDAWVELKQVFDPDRILRSCLFS